jgi:hypothetical protein
VRRPVLFVALLAAAGAALLAGCGGEESGPTGKEVTVAPVTNGPAVRDILLDIAKAKVEGDPEKTKDFGIGGAWKRRFPQLEFGRPADPSRIDWRPQFTAIPGREDGAQIMPFAVVDTEGRCLGGVIVIHGAIGATLVPDGFEQVDDVDVPICTREEVARKAGFEL